MSNITASTERLRIDEKVKVWKIANEMKVENGGIVPAHADILAKCRLDQPQLSEKVIRKYIRHWCTNILIQLDRQ